MHGDLLMKNSVMDERSIMMQRKNHGVRNKPGRRPFPKSLGETCSQGEMENGGLS